MSRGGEMRSPRVRKARRARAAAEALESRTLLSADVLTWHDDPARMGLNANETQLTPANVHAGTFGKLFSYPLDGQLYAQPLYVSNLNMGALGTHDVVIVATMHNSVYAFDADNNAGPSGGLLWHDNFGPPATTPSSYLGGRNGPWALIYPYVGIEGTPVIDRASNTIYFDSFTNDGPDIYSHHLHALDITTGAERPDSPVLVAASSPGNGAGGDGTTIPFVANREQQRPALSLLNGTVYVAYGSFDDTDPYHGWLLGYDAATLQLKEVWNSTPNLLNPPGANPGEGAFWQSGAGLSSDGSDLYAMTANGDFASALGDYGDSFVKLAPANDALSVADYFAPYNQQQLAAQDNDLGSAGPMVLDVPGAAQPHLLIGVGKQGTIFVLNRDNMGQFTPTAPDHVLQEVSLGSGAWSNPAYFNGRVYFHGVNGVLTAFSLINGVLSTSPIAQGAIHVAYPGATPSISANGTTNGIVWELDPSGILHAYDALTLSELYNSNQNPGDVLGTYIKFTTPTIADGKVFVGTADSVAVFGLLPQDSIRGGGGNDAITLKQDADHQHIDWTIGAAAGRLPINDPAGLSINGAGGQDTITLDPTNGNPLPNRLTLDGTFTLDGLSGSMLTAGQTIDVGSSTITIPYSDPSLASAVRAALHSGYAGGAWDGPGIVSSAARAGSGFGVAFTDSALGGAPGQPAGSIQLRYTLLGDLNQDGQVNFDDLLALAQHYGKPAGIWSAGDLDYDGSVAFGDLLILAQNYGRHSPDWPNLLQNGDFSQGNTGFTSDYPWSTDLFPDNTYIVGADPSLYHHTVASFGDHTSGSGLMLLANASPTPNAAVWQETVAVTPGTSYTFTGFGASWGGFVNDPSPALMRLQINGQTVGADVPLPAPAGQWAPFTWTWTANASLATLRLIDANTTVSGNNFALDDLSFAATPAAVARAVPGPNPAPVAASDDLPRKRKAQPARLDFGGTPSIFLSNPAAKA